MRHPVNDLWALSVAALAVHNAEEVLAFAGGWTERHLPGLALPTESWPAFAVAATILTLGVASVAWLLRNRPRQSGKALRVFLWLMLINVVWHVGVSACTWSIAPGALTSIVLLLPLYSFVLVRLRTHPPG